MSPPRPLKTKQKTKFELGQLFGVNGVQHQQAGGQLNNVFFPYLHYLSPSLIILSRKVEGAVGDGNTGKITV